MIGSRLRFRAVKNALTSLQDMAENNFPEWVGITVDTVQGGRNAHRNAEPQLGETDSGAKLGLGVPSVGKLFVAESSSTQSSINTPTP
jgi:hypothetical protein